MPNATLQDIQTKVRRLTRSPSLSQLSNEQLNNYINTFILYDLPEQLRLFSLRKTLTFYTQPNIDVYETNTTDVNHPLYNFKNRFITIHPPVYIAGVRSWYTQYRNEFYNAYPKINSITDTKIKGNNTTGPFEGTLSAKPMLRNSVIVSCLDNDNNSMILVDNPIGNNIGLLGLPNVPETTSPSPYGQINYITGEFSITFPNNTKDLSPIKIQNITYQPGKPISMLYFDDKFTLRPVPDESYAVQIEVDARPTELLESGQVPELEQWFQYIAFGAAKKIFEERMDYDSLNRMLPSLKEQELFCLRSTLVQQANMRTQTIYTQGKRYGFGRWFGEWPY